MHLRSPQNDLSDVFHPRGWSNQRGQGRRLAQMAHRSDAPDEIPGGLTPPPIQLFASKPNGGSRDCSTLRWHCLSAGVQRHESSVWASAGRNGPQV